MTKRAELSAAADGPSEDWKTWFAQGLNVRNWRTSLEQFDLDSLPDPSHFADGQDWGYEALRALRLPTEKYRQMLLMSLVGHFESGGTVQAALQWLRHCAHSFSLRERRCVVSYVVRMVRVRRVGRRLMGTGADSAMERLRKVLHMVFVQYSSPAAYVTKASVTLPLELLGPLKQLFEQSVIDSITYEINNNISRPDTVHTVTIQISKRGRRWLETGELYDLN